MLVMTLLDPPPDTNWMYEFGVSVQVVAASRLRTFCAGSRAYNVTATESPTLSDDGQFTIGSMRPRSTVVYAAAALYGGVVALATSVSVPAATPITRKYA